MEGNILYAGLTASGSAATTDNWYNIARDLARVNAKNEEVTDRNGHVYGYLCNVTIKATGPSTVSVLSAPNTWKMRNSVRKAHFLREHMFREAGVTKSEKGTYGQTIRPHLFTGMVTDSEYKNAQYLTPGGSPSSGEFTAGEWTYTSLVSTPSFDDRSIDVNKTLPLADNYNLALCGANVIEDDSLATKTFTTIGLIHSYNLDRMERIPDATADSSLVNPNNPFAMLSSQSVAGGEVIDIAADQELEAPPYDVADNGASIQLCYKSVSQVNTTESVRKFQVFLPAGLMCISSTAVMSTALINVDVVAKVLCKDMA